MVALSPLFVDEAFEVASPDEILVISFKLVIVLSGVPDIPVCTRKNIWIFSYPHASYSIVVDERRIPLS